MSDPDLFDAVAHVTGEGSHEIRRRGQHDQAGGPSGVTGGLDG
jgi:hypothetical protein